MFHLHRGAEDLRRQRRVCLDKSLNDGLRADLQALLHAHEVGFGRVIGDVAFVIGPGDPGSRPRDRIFADSGKRRREMPRMDMSWTIQFFKFE